MALLRALHRRLALALGLAVFAAGIVGSAAWVLVPRPEFTAKSVLQVNSVIPSLMFAMVDNEARGGEDYKRFQNNQVGLIQSLLVLNSALSSLDAGKLQTLANQKDPVDYLKKKLLVSFPNGSDLLEIQLSGRYPEELATIVNAVTQAYQEEVVNYDRKKRLERAEKLQKTYDRQFDDLKARYVEKKRLAETVGTEDPETIAKKQQLQDQALSELKREAMQIHVQRQKLEVDRDVAKHISASKRGNGPNISRDEIDTAILRVPSVAQLSADYSAAVAKYRQAEGYASRTVRVPHNDVQVKQWKAEVDRLAKAFDAEQAAVRPLVEQQLLANANATQDDELLKLQLHISALMKQEKELNEQIATDSKVMHRINQDSLEIKDKQREIEQLDRLNSMMQEEIAKLGVELQAPERVREIEKATTPRESAGDKRLVMIGGSTVGAFFGCLCLVALLEFRSRKLTTADEVVEGLGIQLVGSLPPLPARVRRRGLSSGEAENEDWYRVMLESIDSTRTMVVHQARENNLRVLLVTSALGGEGKTSLSSHLATSLARAGYSVLLLDADLRSPAVDRVFGLPVSPGLSDVLRGEIEVEAAIQPSSLPELRLLTAGAYDEEALRQLNRGALASIFDDLRARFEFIVVDSAPVLPVADTQIIAPFADAVVFSTLRDVSRLPKVFAAYQRLASLGVRILGAVVTGISGGLYANDQRYGYGYAYGTPRKAKDGTPPPPKESVADA
jgi:capsular exopolysaccharide synthesis family protein